MQPVHEPGSAEDSVGGIQPKQDPLMGPSEGSAGSKSIAEPPSLPLKPEFYMFLQQMFL